MQLEAVSVHDQLLVPPTVVSNNVNPAEKLRGFRRQMSTSTVLRDTADYLLPMWQETLDCQLHLPQSSNLDVGAFSTGKVGLTILR